jgi:hypothetical protein
VIGVHLGANKEPKSSNNIGNFIKLAIDKFKNKKDKIKTYVSNQKFKIFGQKIEKMVKNTPTTTNISDNVSISYETINSNKKYNAGIKQNINKINIKEQKNDIYIPYSTILKIESGIDLSHDKLGKK